MSNTMSTKSKSKSKVPLFIQGSPIQYKTVLQWSPDIYNRCIVKIDKQININHVNGIKTGCITYKYMQWQLKDIDKSYKYVIDKIIEFSL